MNIPDKIDVSWMRENAPNTLDAVCRVLAGDPEYFPDLEIPDSEDRNRGQKICPRCQKPMEFLPGRGTEPDRWFCPHRLPYSNEFCGYETEE